MFRLEGATRHPLLSPPLWGRAGEGGSHGHRRCGSPPSLTLPHKGGGSGESQPGPYELRGFP